MNTNVNLEASVGILAFLGTAFIFGLAALIVIHENSFWHKKTKFRLVASEDSEHRG